ncbi:MAG: hypothetical protein K2H33_02925 [Muribaculaceae bacterium]|nr:hypothetical protein [Muribaculaceae bacterium]
MILIKKGPEPKSWKEYRNTPGADYQSTKDLVDALLKEQGYICAYCMRRIPCKDRLGKTKDGKDTLTSEDHRVEHMLSREKHDDLKLDYGNMVMCCPGHIGSDDHCDRLKGPQDISFSPTDQRFIDTLTYKSTGEIESSDSGWNDEITGILNLNTTLLAQNRKSTLDAVIQKINLERRGRNWNRTLLEKYLEKYSTMHRCADNELRHHPYCGIVTHYLRKKLRTLP